MRLRGWSGGIVLALALVSLAAAPAPTLTVLLTPQRAAEMKLPPLAPAFAVDARGAVVLAAGEKLQSLGGKRVIATAPSALSDCVFAPDGALFAISGDVLGYAGGGRFLAGLKLPGRGMRLAASQDRLYVFGGEREGGKSLYMVEPNRGHVRLCVMPAAIGAAAVRGDTLYFAAANDVYRLVPGGELNLLCRLPGPAISSLAAVGDDELFFLAGRSLYAFRRGNVALIGADMGDAVRARGRDLYLLDTGRKSLVRLSNLDMNQGRSGDEKGR